MAFKYSRVVNFSFISKYVFKIGNVSSNQKLILLKYCENKLMGPFVGYFFCFSCLALFLGIGQKQRASSSRNLKRYKLQPPRKPSIFTSLIHFPQTEQRERKNGAKFRNGNSIFKISQKFSHVNFSTHFKTERKRSVFGEEGHLILLFGPPKSYR